MFVNMLSIRIFRPKILSTYCLAKRHKYYILLPEIPDDTPETNPLLRTSSLPSFSDLTYKKCVNAIGKLIIEYESGIHQLDKQLSDPSVPKTVPNVILPLDRLTIPLDFAFAMFKIVYTLKPDDDINHAFIKLHPRILKAKREQYLAPSIYKSFKELSSSENQLTEPVQRIVRKHMLESRLSGMDLPDNKLKEFTEILIKVQEHKVKYRDKLMRCTANFSQTLEMNDVKNFPRDFLHQISVNRSSPLNGPWRVTLAPEIYSKFMEHCDNRPLRWNLWHAKNIRCSSSTAQELNNSIEIEEIRKFRTNQANILGYENFSELSMQTKMAGNIKNAMALLTTLHVKSQDVTRNEIETLQDFATKSGFEHKLELWDLAFWQNKHKKELFGLDDAAIRQYFPLPAVLKGLFEFCHKLFGISIVESNPEVEAWHQDVTFYRIFDDNEVPIATFYLDPYARPLEKGPGAWMEIGRNRSEVIGSEPLSYLIFNFSPPEAGKPSLISFNDVIILLQKFGHVLQHSLTTMPYNGVAGLTNLEWDVVNVCPHFMSYWLYHYNTAASLSNHVETGERLPAELHKKLVKAHTYMSGLRLTEGVYLSALDLELYSRKNFWYEITKALWLRYLPFPFERTQAHPCSFPQIFCDEYPAAYFSSLWAEMIAADVFAAFEEEGLENTEAVKENGRRFRDTYLSLGGGCHPSEVFRRFRGRDPSVDALVHRHGFSSSVLKPFTSLL